MNGVPPAVPTAPYSQQCTEEETVLQVEVQRTKDFSESIQRLLKSFVVIVNYADPYKRVEDL